jgi:hypothetical protein
MPTFSKRLKSTLASLARPLTPEDGRAETDLSDAEARLSLMSPSRGWSATPWPRGISGQAGSWAFRSRKSAGSA